MARSTSNTTAACGGTSKESEIRQMNQPNSRSGG
jgi:hypothetical protein